MNKAKILFAFTLVVQIIVVGIDVHLQWYGFAAGIALTAICSTIIGSKRL